MRRAIVLSALLGGLACEAANPAFVRPTSNERLDAALLGADARAVDAVARPVVDTASPAVDMARPPVDMAKAPAVDVASPVIDMARPPVDAAKPAVDMASPPPVDAASPPIDMASPPIDMAVERTPPPDAPPSHGLKGEYFNEMLFIDPVTTRIDKTVDFDWVEAAPVPGMDGQTFSVRWTGTIRVPASDTYTIYTFSDDGARVWIDGRLVVDGWNNQAGVEYKGTFTFVAGRVYPIKVEYYENLGYAVMRLLWSSATIERQVVPATALSPAP